jgi:hypothetical protein
MEDKEILQEAINRYGEDYQTDRMLEEMSELTKELLKFRRNGGMNHSDVLDEMVDVEIMLEQMKMIHLLLPDDERNFKDRREFKINRLRDRLGL